MKSNYQDQVYNYKGLWDIPSMCGLKIVKKSNKTIVIATELYENNPGTSVADWNTKLAKELCTKYEIDPKSIVFIEHTPDKETKLKFNLESFFQVKFDFENDQFVNPNWKQITKEEVDKLIND